ncbi:MAG TPA: Crp/Fnr family transcriptional regulator [Pseudogracilibacillus sp.]|nr:Crp/Fnr family transcriptional regulator [Pseudogracilibacillus sp.]
MKDYEKVNILRQFSNLEDLTDDEYNKIKPFLMHKKINKNEHLFHCGEKMESIYFLISGKIKTYKTNVNGKEFLVQLYSGKDVFPHIGYYFHVDKYPVSALVLKDVELFYIPLNNLYQILSSSNTFCIFFLKVMGAKTIDLQHRLEDKILSSTMEQVVHMLIRLSEKYGIQLVNQNAILLNEPLHNTDLANMVGMTRETISRMMNQLYEEKIIRKDREGRLLINMKKLKAFNE